MSPHVPRPNGACERRWRTMARDTRAKLETSKLPVSFWWYHLKSSTEVSALLPSRITPNESPCFSFTRQVPSCTEARPIGCRLFAKIMLQPHKLSPQSTPCVYLGRPRDQPGHAVHLRVTTSAICKD
eukprot:6146197-Pleurochrysis_carterae.AAC.1